jgi:hypothetical protein
MTGTHHLRHMKNLGIYVGVGLSLCGIMAQVQAQPSVQVVWEGPATQPLRDSSGVVLSAGLVTDGDGVLLELGYFDAGTPASPFSGKFVALTGGASADPSLRSTSVGDSGGGAAGTFSISTNFNAGAAVFQGAPPAAGTPLVIRFFNGNSVTASTHYNVVSGGSNWQWKTPAEAPGAFVILSLADAGLVWQGGAASSFKTSIQGPPPEVSTGGGGGSGGDEEVQAIVGAALVLNVPGGSSAPYRTTYLPPGLRLNTDTGEVSGVPTVPGIYRVLVTPSDALGVAQTAVEFKVNVAALSKGVVGKFSGLVERSPILNSNLGASLQLSTTAAGLYTGRLLVGARSYTLRGRLGLDPARPSEANLSLQLPQLGPNVALALEFDGATQSFEGTLTQNGTAAAVAGWQIPWSPALPATSLQGAYTYRLSLPASADAALPQGYGYGLLKVSASTGLVALTSTLADGTRVTGSAALGKDGEVAVYSSSVNASLLGQLALTAGTSALSRNALVGTLSWLKSAVAGTVYAAGFGPVDLEVAGGTPVAVPKGSLVLDLDAVSETRPQNAVLSFAEGGLESTDGAFFRDVAVKTTTSVAKNTVTIPDGTPKVVMPTLNPATGAFAGTFLLEGGSSVTIRSVRFQGQVVTIDGETQGYGYFLLPMLPSGTLTLSTSPKLSGSVLFAKP